jgi:hypothetical protein
MRKNKKIARTSHTFDFMIDRIGNVLFVLFSCASYYIFVLAFHISCTKLN